MPSTICETLVTFSKMSLPYLAFGIFVLGLIFAFKCRQKDTALIYQHIQKSSEGFLSFSFIRYAMLFILVVFITATLFPKLVFWWTAHYIRLMVIQSLLISAAILAAVGSIQFAFSLMKATEGKFGRLCFQVLFLFILTAQLLASVSLNFLYGWEISWFTAIAVPYLGSVLTFEPDTQLLNNLPWLIQLYLAQGLLVFAIAPFFSISWALFNPKCRSFAKS
jgi:hypothetical protein